MAALAAVELVVVVAVDGRGGAAERGPAGAAAEPRRALLLEAPEPGRRRLRLVVGAAAALAALLGQVPRQGRALGVHFPVEDLEDLQTDRINASLFQNYLVIFFFQDSIERKIHHQELMAPVIWNGKRVEGCSND